jgi:hypothetical protein
MGNNTGPVRTAEAKPRHVGIRLLQGIVDAA